MAKHLTPLHHALLHETIDGEGRCLTCERRCVLADGQVGRCRTRQNRGGTLCTLIYGLVFSLACNPIEKKPLFHFYPGSVALTAGSWSCNFACPWCQNWDISKRPPSGGRALSPDEVGAHGLRCGRQGTLINFSEPTLSLEGSLACFPVAQKAVYDTFVSNGYTNEAALELLVEAALDAMNVDVKGDASAVGKHCQADVEVVWRKCRLAHGRGVWVVVTTLLIPGLNDSADTLQAIAGRIATELGRDTPWHVSCYYPAYRFTAPPTPAVTLEQTRDIGLEAGLRYVYLGNVPGRGGEHTACPRCGTILIRRTSLRPVRCEVSSDGHRPQYDLVISGIWLKGKRKGGDWRLEIGD